jgi:hypothetical protein
LLSEGRRLRFAVDITAKKRVTNLCNLVEQGHYLQFNIENNAIFLLGSSEASFQELENGEFVTLAQGLFSPNQDELGSKSRLCKCPSRRRCLLFPRISSVQLLSRRALPDRLLFGTLP